MIPALQRVGVVVAVPRGWALAETCYRPRLPDSVSPNAHKAVREHPGRNTVTIFRVWWPCGFHPGRPERRRGSRNERWRLGARWTGWRGQKFPSHRAFTAAASLTNVDSSLNAINTTLGTKQNTLTFTTPLKKDVSNNISIDLSGYPLKTYVDGSLNTINSSLATKQNTI